MTKMKKAALGLLCMATLLLGGCGQVKLGYVDEARIAEEAPQMKALIDEAKQKTTQAQEEAIANLQKKAAEGASDEELQKEQLAAQRKLQGLSQSYGIQMRQKLDGAVAEAIKGKNIDAVINNSADQKLLMMGGTDFTDEVIQKLQ